MRTEDYKRELISIIFTQKHVIFWTAFAIFLGASVIAFYWPPTFGSSGSLLVRSKQATKNPENLEGEGSRVFPLTKEDLASEAEFLTAPEVIEKTVKYLGVEYPQYAGKGDAELADQVYGIINNLKIEVVPVSNVIDIQYRNRDPKLAVDTLRVLMEQYIIYRMKIFNPSESIFFFSKQAERFRSGLEEKENEFMDLIDNAGAADFGKEIENNIILKKTLEEELNTLRSTLIEKENTYAHLAKALENNDLQYFSFIESYLINNLSIKLAELYVERGNSLRVYLPESEVISSYNDQIDDTFAALQKEATAYNSDLAKQIDTLKAQIADLEGTIAGYDARNVDLQKLIVESQRIQRERDLLEFSYDTFSKRREEAEVNEALDSSGISNSVSILHQAYPSDGPVFPKPGLLIPLGLLAGLLTGCGLGFVREYFDHTFKNPGNVQTYTNLPVLFSLSRPTNKVFSLLYNLVVLLLVIGLLAFIVYNFQASALG